MIRNLLLAAVAASAVLAATAFDNQSSAASHIISTLFADGATNAWTQADLKAALQLINRKYHRDMKLQKGRIDWHGPVVRRVVETNDLRLIEYHEDGFAHTNRWEYRKSMTPAERAKHIETIRLKRARDLAARTNGYPQALIAARRAAIESVRVIETNIVIEANR